MNMDLLNMGIYPLFIMNVSMADLHLSLTLFHYTQTSRTHSTTV